MLKGNYETGGLKFGFAIAFIVILSLSATLVGPISEASAKTIRSSTTSFLGPSAKIESTNVAHSHKHSHVVSDSTPRFTPHSPSKQAASSLPSAAASLTSASPIQITAGKIQNISFMINNNNPTTSGYHATTPLTTITQLAVTLTSQNLAVRILGPTTWNLPTISSGSAQQLTTQVFASTSAISTPVFFTVTIQYIQNGYQVRTTSFNLGAVVVGLIQLGVNNLNVRYTGDSPTLSGNILNQGNTAALFSTIKMLTQTPLSSASNKNLASILVPTSSQYLGTISANLPLPFNIPLQAIPTLESQHHNQPVSLESTAGNENNITALNAYPVSLEIIYTDNLKNVHNLIINGTVTLPGPVTQQRTLSGDTLQGSSAVGLTEQRQQEQPPPQPAFGNGFIDAYWAQNIAQSTVNSGSSISANGSFVSTTLPSPLRVQAGPGYGVGILAVVLSNTAFYAIGGITGYLTLPPGFTAATDGLASSSQTSQQPETAIAAFPGTAQIGQTYTIYFKVRIGDTATVGNHLAYLKLYYYQLPLITPGQYSVQTVSVPFNLPGTVVLDAVPKTTALNPGQSNQAIIQLINRGSAAAHNVVATIGAIKASNVNPPTTSTVNTNATQGGQIVTINPPSLIPTVNLGPSTFNVGTIPVNGTAVIDPILYPADSASGTLQNLNFSLSYIDPGGNTQTSSNSIGFRVLPEPPQAGLNVAPSGGLEVGPSGGLSVAPSGGLGAGPSNSTTSLFPTPHSRSHSHHHFGQSNSPSGITVTASYTSEPKSISNDTMNDNVRIIPAVYKVTIANNSNAGATHSSIAPLPHIADVTNSSNNNNLNAGNGPPQNSTSVNKSSHQNSTSLILTALTLQDMKFHITNYNDFPITDLVVSISSQSGDVKIVGDNVWTVPVIPPHSTHEFTTKVYASTSLIAAPVSFNVLLQYITQAQSQSGSFVLGATVVGNIIPKVSGGLSINYIAGVPNLVGNLLNEGTTTGLYTTVQMINQPFRPSNSSTAAPGAEPGGNGPSSFHQQSSNSSYPGSRISLPPPQYLGDLQADSPLPFSIPLTVDINNTAPGTYPVILRVSYSDDLHNPHVTYLHDSVVVAPHPPPPANNGGPLAFLGLGGGGPPHVHGRHGGVGVGIHHPFGIPLVIWIIIIAAIIVAVVFIRKRRKAKQKLLISESAKEALEDEGGDEDIESLIDGGKKGTSSDSQV
ncbi:MAG TPA: hypothetical protein VEL11_12570 [Candidatus Bathyarchaeia archaeon]|nr:hypothetical protein [Candidatus Bathyarchaeia archaeon]